MRHCAKYRDAAQRHETCAFSFNALRTEPLVDHRHDQTSAASPETGAAPVDQQIGLMPILEYIYNCWHTSRHEGSGVPG